MKKPYTKEAVLAHLRCVRARAMLVQNEVDFLGMAVRDELMSPAAAQAFIELYGLDYMGVATLEAARKAYFSGEDAELDGMLDSEDQLQEGSGQERKPFHRTP